MKSIMILSILKNRSEGNDKMKKKYIIDVANNYGKLNNAGPKARRDINYFLANDFMPVYFINGKNRALRFVNLIGLFLLVKIKAKAVIVQYPYSLSEKYNKMIEKYLVKDNAILFIHDLDTLRSKADNDSIKREIDVINQYKCVVSHNKKMTSWLKENGCKSYIVELDIFDYYVRGQKKNVITKNAVAFAGNLSREKSGFIYEWNSKDVDLDVYGSNFCPAEADNIIYKGSFGPDELPTILCEKYGLVWDGDSLKTCNGAYGNYLRYNNPHKTSLYLAAGIPVIVWNESAMAEFVEKNNVGIVVNDLEKLDERIGSISEAMYKEIKANTLHLSKKLRNGYYTQKAIQECLHKMDMQY